MKSMALGRGRRLCFAVLLAVLVPAWLVAHPIVPFDGPFYIEREGYTLCYDGRSRNPIWVYTYLTLDDLTGSAERKDNYRQDPDLPAHVRSTKPDYKHSGYSRGHMEPAANHKDSQKNMDETFFLSNMAPQVQDGFNGGTWRTLEQWCRGLIDHDTSAHIITGPLYLVEVSADGDRGVSYPVIGGNDVAVPTHFYKIVIAEHADGRRDGYAFILPHRAIYQPETFWDFEVEIEEAEARAGIALSPVLKPRGG
ncbi:MAG: DNA/RNA non-specific endonuclease [Candidatus Obscuribacterales bacterium]